MRNSFDDLMDQIKSSGQNWSPWDLQIAQENPDAGMSIFTQKQRYANATTDAERRAANAAAEAIRSQYGRYLGGSAGDEYTVLPGMKKPPAYKPPEPQQVKPDYAPSYTEYVSQYSQQIQSTLDKLLNREKFSYDPAKDVNYQAIAEGNRRTASKARQNAMGDAAAMTGGQINSAALAAGMLAENDANARTSDAIPALMQAAYGMYMGDLNQDRADLNALIGLDEIGYGRHKDTYNANFGKWQADHGVDREILEDQRLAEQQAYDRWRDQVADTRYENKDDFDKMWRSAQLLAAAGDFSGFAALGFNPTQIEKMELAARKPLKIGKSDEDKLPDYDLGGMSAGDVKKWVKNMLDNADGSQFNPEAVIQGTRELTGDQKALAMDILDAYIDAGYMKYPRKK